MENISLNKDFLNQIAEQQEHDIYIHITALNNDEEPLDEIEGKITGGSISLDGDSVIRRTCSLTMITNKMNINEQYWTKKTKFKLEIGLKNYLTGKYSIQNNYPDIVWFPQGIYIIATFNTSLSTNNCDISISGKDKMSLLNGELGGSLFSSVDFGTEETVLNTMVLNSDIDLETALKGSYYIISQRNYINKGEFQNQYIQDDPIFIYIQDNEGNFYTENGVIFNKIIQDNSIEDNKERYQIYELVKSIKNKNLLFSNPVTFNQETSYQQNKFYYKDELKGYVLSTSKYAITGMTYYALKDIYKRNLEVVKEKVLIEKIIREMIHTYAQEPYHKIIINDLDSQGLEKLIFKGEKAYIIYNEDKSTVSSFYLANQSRPLENCVKQKPFYFYEPLNPEQEPTPIYNGKYGFTTNRGGGMASPYYVRKILYGEDVGYRLTPLTYAGDLIANIGESLTSVLDKIKTMLGEFEYFYDTEGNFVFQKKKNYLQTSWNELNITEDSYYIDFNKYKISYQFINNQLISNISSSPSLTNIKNDFTVWGKRKGLSGAEIPIHARYAIDKKPIYYQTLNKRLFFSKEILQKKASSEDFPTKSINEENFSLLAAAKQNELFEWSDGWWELNIWINFYENILGFSKEIDKTVYELFYFNDISCESVKENLKNLNNITFNQLTTRTFLIQLDSNKTTLTTALGRSPLSFYLQDMEQNDTTYYIYSPLFSNYKSVDWREIIYQMATDYFSGQGASEEKSVYLGEKDQYLTDPDSFLYFIGQRNPEYYPSGKTGYEQYYADLQGFWRQLYDPFYQTEEYYTIEENINKCYWNKKIDYPETLDFWFDFLNVEDEKVELLKFSIPKIGDRSKVVNEDKASSIVFNTIPDIIFYTDNIEQNKISTFSGDTFIKIPGFYSQYFTISTKSLSVKDKIDELLYQHTYCAENISITSIPIYHLQPNTRILVKDDETGINGEYIIHKITIPLTYNGTMSISASKAPERLY